MYYFNKNRTKQKKLKVHLLSNVWFYVRTRFCLRKTKLLPNGPTFPSSLGMIFSNLAILS